MEGPDRSALDAGLERPGEGPLQRADRNMVELLQELRLAQTGVRSPRFASLEDLQR
jgi:hypothetical protein